MSFLGYKFARIYMSGFQSAPIDKVTLAKKEFINGFISKIEPRMIAQNVSIFSDYDFNFEASSFIFTGVTDIFDSNYSSIRLTTKTGYINVVDVGATDPSGFFIASGYVTGEFIDIYINKVHAGYDYSLYLYNDKTYGGGGSNSYNQLGPQDLSNIKEIQAGTSHSLVLFENGTITGFGDNSYGKIAGVPSYTDWNQTPVGKLSGVQKISTQNSFSMALFNNGTITGWGNNSYGQTSGTTGNVSSWSQTPLSSLTGIVDINAGNSFGLVLFNNGTITGWGADTYGEVSSGLYLTGVSSISAGTTHSLALLNNGRVTGWGDNTSGKALGGNNLTGVLEISAGWDHNLALLKNGKVTGWGDNSYNQALGGNNLNSVSGISAGGFHSLAILNNKNVTGWGSNSQNQIINFNYEPPMNNIVYQNETFLKSENLKMIGGDITIGPPIGYREKIYLGEFTGIATFNDYFYSVEDQTITFIKKVQYSIFGTGTFNQTFTVLNTVSVNGEIPTINALDAILRGRTAFVSEEQDLTVYGYLQNYPLLRNNISGFGLISGSVSGIGTGIIDFNRLVSGQTLSAFTTQPVGYRNASGVLNYNSPILGDFIILTNDATGSNFNFIYETGEEFTPPVYFNSINTLNNIINSGSGDYSVKSTIQNNNLILESLIPGAEGNFFRVISEGSTGVPAISGEYFTSGITYRNPITPTGIFTGLLNTGLYVTGYFQQLITGTLVKDITGLIGYRPFTGLWDLYEVATNNGISEYINIKNTGIFTESTISTNYTGYSKETVNRKTFSISYTNSPDFASVDVVKLNISLNSGISGYSYNIILTGNTQLNTTITIPTGNTIPVK
jgi:alpha-tubulin suppressor-like RCC1 family protein